jgi:hypothetical protein
MQAKHFSLFLLVSILSCAIAAAQTATKPTGPLLVPSPPLGWNSWDSYGLRINEQQFRDNVDVIAARLKPAGYKYAVIDEGWYMFNPQDRPRPEQLKYSFDVFGRFIPVPDRFPSSLEAGKITGFEQLGAWVHSKGLKFGIHIIRGIPRESVEKNAPIEGSSFKAQNAADTSDPCPWDPTSWGIKDNAAGQAWYDSLLRQYARWGVDFVKVDCIADHPYKVSEIRQIRSAIEHSGRAMVLSLSPGPMQLEHHAEVAELAEMWRMSNDIWDIWDSGNAVYPIGMRNQFANAARWAQYNTPGHWPDADMLPVGELRPYPDAGPGPRHTRLTSSEQQMMLTLWAMARSPLIVGANLTLLDDATARLLTNPDMLRIDQTATASREALREGDFVAWTANLPGKEFALALFNIGEKPITVDRSLSDFALSEGVYSMCDVWTGKKLTASARTVAALAPHAAILLVLKKD